MNLAKFNIIDIDITIRYAVLNATDIVTLNAVDIAIRGAINAVTWRTGVTRIAVVDAIENTINGVMNELG